jgi:hypothetical protein
MGRRRQALAIERLELSGKPAATATTPLFEVEGVGSNAVEQHLLLIRRARCAKRFPPPCAWARR